MNDEIMSFLADIVAAQKWGGPCLSVLLSTAPGEWSTISAICRDVPDALQKYLTLVQGDCERVVATWLPHPSDDDSVLIMSYDIDENACTTAIVTRYYIRTLGISPARCENSAHVP